MNMETIDKKKRHPNDHEEDGTHHKNERRGNHHEEVDEVTHKKQVKKINNM